MSFAKIKSIKYIGLTLFLALLVACEIPSPTASEPQPVDSSEPADGGTDPGGSTDPGGGSTADTPIPPPPTDVPAPTEPVDGSGGGGPGDDVDPTEPPRTGDQQPGYPAPTETTAPVPTIVPPTATIATDQNQNPTVTEEPAATNEAPTEVPPTTAPTSTPEPAPPGTPSVQQPDTVTDIFHTVQPGENLYRIGLQYNVSWTVLQLYNGLPNANSIKVGQVIRIPVVSPAQPGGSGSNTAPSTSVVHRVSPGESLFLIGLHYGRPWTEIAEANGIMNPTSLKAGQLIKIPLSSVGLANEFQHVVGHGENLYLISLRYGVAWHTIAARNNIYTPYTIHPNQGLTIPSMAN